MGERFQRTSWDRHGVSKTEFNVDNSRSGETDFNVATTRITKALSEWKNFALPGEIKNKDDVSLRVEDLRGNFTTIVRMVILQLTRQGIRQEIIDRLEDFICYSPGDIEGETVPTGNEEYGFGLCKDFYLTRLPFLKALNIFRQSIEANYFRELMRRYPDNPEKRAELAGISEQKLEKRMSENDLSSSPLPVSYNLRYFPDESFPTLQEIYEKDERAFSSLYIDSLRERTGNNFDEMLKMFGGPLDHLNGMLRRFPA